MFESASQWKLELFRPEMQKYCSSILNKSLVKIESNLNEILVKINRIIETPPPPILVKFEQTFG
jgi:hypothetical protein